MSKLTRREFLEVAEAGAVAAVGLSAAACVPMADPTKLDKPKVPGLRGWHEHEERFVTSVCGQCAAGCGVRVRVVEGRAVKIEGSPDFPLNQGSVGPKGQAGLQVLYNPARVVGPMQRDGARGSGKWKPIAWKEAIALVAEHLGKLRQSGEARSLVVLDGEPRGRTRELWERFLSAYGSPNHVDHRAATDGGKLLAMTYMHGVPELPAYDWDSARYVLGFGSSLFESWCQTIHLTRAQSVLHRGLQGYRAKFVQISPRLSSTAAKADEWVAIEPATYGALALGLAHVLIRDRLYDEGFVQAHTFGFESWKDARGQMHQGFREHVLASYPPEKVAEITGVPVATIERLAQEAARFRPALAIADGSAAAATNGIGTAMAIHALNALLGNLERPGGMLVQRQVPLTPWPALALDATAKTGLGAPRLDGAGTADNPLGASSVQRLPAAILAGAPYQAGAVFLYYSNPVFSKPDGKRWQEALQKTPLVVSFSPLWDESTHGADLVLPDHTYLERWDLTEPVPAMGFPVIGLRQPAVVPQHDTRQTGDVVLQLAQALGGAVAQALPWESYKAAVSERLAGVGELSALEEKGGLWQTERRYEAFDAVFATPSRKFEFYAQAMQQKLAAVFGDGLEAALAARGVQTRGDALYMPHYEPARLEGDEADYPFVLVPYRTMSYAEGGVRHQPWLVELNRAVENPWREHVELHPDDARALGVRDNDEVWVESLAGKRRLRVLIHAGTRPRSVGLPLGRGTWPPRPGEETPGGYGLIANHSDPLAGILALQCTRVRVTRA